MSDTLLFCWGIFIITVGWLALIYGDVGHEP